MSNFFKSVPEIVSSRVSIDKAKNDTVCINFADAEGVTRSIVMTKGRWSKIVGNPGTCEQCVVYRGTTL